jgi:hypothetical protein
MEQLEADVAAHLWGRVHDLRIVREAKGLVLRGRTANYYAKQLAQHFAMKGSHVPVAANEIEVGWAG